MERDYRLKLVLRGLAVILLCTGAAVLSGCQVKSSYSLGCEAYGQGDYRQAEGHFLDALAERVAQPVYYLAYAYNLFMLEDYEGCRGVLNTMFEELPADKPPTDDEKKEAYYLLASSSEKLGDYEAAAAFYEEMGLLVTDLTVQQNIDRVIFTCYLHIFDGLMEPENKTGLEEYYNKTASYASLHSELMDAEDYTSLAGMSLYMHGLDLGDGQDRPDFIEQAQTYIRLSRKLGGADAQKLDRYEIIIAEELGKVEVAYKLLEVYADHYPDDASALLEQEFLNDRLRKDQTE